MDARSGRCGGRSTGHACRGPGGDTTLRAGHRLALRDDRWSHRTARTREAACAALGARGMATTASALMIGLALIAGLAVLASSVKASVSDGVRNELTSDYVLNGGTSPVRSTVAGGCAPPARHKSAPSRRSAWSTCRSAASRLPHPHRPPRTFGRELRRPNAHRTPGCVEQRHVPRGPGDRDQTWLGRRRRRRCLRRDAAPART